MSNVIKTKSDKDTTIVKININESIEKSEYH